MASLDWLLISKMLVLPVWPTSWQRPEMMRENFCRLLSIFFLFSMRESLWQLCITFYLSDTSNPVVVVVEGVLIFVVLPLQSPHQAVLVLDVLQLQHVELELAETRAVLEIHEHFLNVKNGLNRHS